MLPVLLDDDHACWWLLVLSVFMLIVILFAGLVLRWPWSLVFLLAVSSAFPNGDISKWDVSSAFPTATSRSGMCQASSTATSRVGRADGDVSKWDVPHFNVASRSGMCPAHLEVGCVKRCSRSEMCQAHLEVGCIRRGGLRQPSWR